MGAIDLDLSFTSILTSVIVGNILILALWLILSTNKGIRYVNINFIIIFIVLIMIRLFLPFEYNFTTNIACPVVLPFTYKLVYNYLAIGSGGVYIYQILLLIWVTGFFAKLYQLVVHYHKLCLDTKNLPDCDRIKSILIELHPKKKRHTNFKVVIVSGLITPVIFGLRRPTIMIPDHEYTHEELTYILRHEMEHYYQHDLWIKAVLEILCALYWWNPLCRVLKKQASKALELRTDTKVIKTMDERQRMKYLECLLKVAKSRSKQMNNLALGFGGKETSLKQRFCYILDYQIAKRKSLIIVNSFLAGIIIFLSTTIILEPYAIKPEDTAHTFTINKNNSFVVRYKDGYDLYIDSTYYVTIDELKDELLDLPIYESAEKALISNRKPK